MWWYIPYSPSTLPPRSTKISHLMALQIPKLTSIETIAVRLKQLILNSRTDLLEIAQTVLTCPVKSHRL